MFITRVGVFIYYLLFCSSDIQLCILFVIYFTVLEVQQEGKYAIDSPGNPTAPVIPPEEYELGKQF